MAELESVIEQKLIERWRPRRPPRGGRPPTYTAAELIAAAPEKFGVSRDIATAALRMAGKKSATVEEAKTVITAFATKEVK